MLIKTEQRKDGGWGYVIVAGCFINNMLIVGLIKTYGILFVQFLRQFQTSASVTSVILGVKSAAFSLSAMMALNVLITKMSIRKLCLIGAGLTSSGMLLSVVSNNIPMITLSQGILTGLGNGVVFGPGLYLIGQYFEQKRGLAMAVSSSGISIGLMLFPPLVTFLFDKYDFQGALLILSGVMMQTIVCASLFRPFTTIKEYTVKSSPSVKVNEREQETTMIDDNESQTHVCGSQENISEKETASDGANKENRQPASICSRITGFFRSVNISLFKSPVFIVIVGFSFFGFIGNELCGAFIPALAKEKGLTDMQTAELFTVAAALDLFSRLIPGIASQFNLITRPNMMALAFISMGTTFQFTAFYNSYHLMMIFIVVYGMFSGFFFSIFPIFIMDKIGLQLFPQAMGFVSVIQGLAGALAYPVLGSLKDVTGSYVSTFHFLGANMLLAAAILLTEPLLRRLEDRRKTITETE